MQERGQAFLRCDILGILLLLYYLTWVQVGDESSFVRAEGRTGLSSFACTRFIIY